MTRVTVSLGEHDAARLTARAQSEGRSVSQMARVLIERGLGASEGEAAAAAAASPDTPESVAVKAQQARAVMEKAIETLHSPADYVPPEHTPSVPEETADAAVPAEASDSPAPATPQPIPKSLEQVLGDPKQRPKPKGAVSARQAVLAEEARLRAQQRVDMFSLVCPNREQHEPGVRCPLCKGIQ